MLIPGSPCFNLFTEMGSRSFMCVYVGYCRRSVVESVCVYFVWIKSTWSDFFRTGQYLSHRCYLCVRWRGNGGWMDKHTTYGSDVKIHQTVTIIILITNRAPVPVWFSISSTDKSSVYVCVCLCLSKCVLMCKEFSQFTGSIEPDCPNWMGKLTN